MEVIYDVYLEDEIDDEDSPMRKIELIFSRLAEEEKELLELIGNKKEKFEKNNVNLEVTEDREDSYVISLEKEKTIAALSLRMPDATRYYYIHYKERTNNFIHYDWFDEEYYTISEIIKQLDIILDRFLKERKNVSISTNK